MRRVALVVLHCDVGRGVLQLHQRPYRINTALYSMRIQIEEPERFLDDVRMFENVVAPQATPFLVRKFLCEDSAKIREMPVHRWVTADNGNDARILGQTSCRHPEIFRSHFPIFVLIHEQSGTIRAVQIAFVGDVDANDPHLIWASHLRDRLKKRWTVRTISDKVVHLAPLEFEHEVVGPKAFPLGHHVSR